MPVILVTQEAEIRRITVRSQLDMIKARAHKGEVRIGKTPKKLASICCP
jgi:hypothetical protein